MQQNVVVERQILSKCAWITLAATTSDQLPIDSRRIVQLCADYMKTIEVNDAVFQLDIGTATGHVCRDGNPTMLPRFRYDFSLRGDVVGIQDLKSNAFRPQLVC